MGVHAPKNTAQRLFKQGCELKLIGKLPEAIVTFTAAIKCDAGFAEAYFERGACHYLLGHFQQTASDMDSASLFGCDVAQLWSKFERARNEDDDDEFDTI